MLKVLLSYNFYFYASYDIYTHGVTWNIIFLCVIAYSFVRFAELDNTIGDILLRINKRESYIILKLVKYINKHAASIFNAIQLCAELDT